MFVFFLQFLNDVLFYSGDSLLKFFCLSLLQPPTRILFSCNERISNLWFAIRHDFSGWCFWMFVFNLGSNNKHCSFMTNIIYLFLVKLVVDIAWYLFDCSYVWSFYRWGQLRLTHGFPNRLHLFNVRVLISVSVRLKQIDILKTVSKVTLSLWM